MDVLCAYYAFPKSLKRTLMLSCDVAWVDRKTKTTRKTTYIYIHGLAGVVEELLGCVFGTQASLGWHRVAKVR